MAPHAMTPPNGSAYGPAVVDPTPPVSAPAAAAPPPAAPNDRPAQVFEPMAICGMACRLPGGINTPQELWEFVVNKGDARKRIPLSRYDADTYLGDGKKPGTVPTAYGYFLENDLSAIDSSFFSMPAKELEHCDPQQRLLLEVTREALEDAGETAWRGRSIGVYVGNFAEDWLNIVERDSMDYNMYNIFGSVDFNLSNRISYEMDLQGPSVTVRTACSASLVALNQACLAISQGQCESAVIGGSNLILTAFNTARFSELGVMAQDGNCKSFSADGDGYARGEGVNAIYIKTLKDAIRDGNPVRAVIRATCVNSDGKTPGLTFPSTAAQTKLMRKTYELAGITDVSKTAFVECHGTGTPAGDPVETKAVGNVFGEHGVHIGSVKPNFGHGEGASGLTSLIKAVMALEHRTIPPNIKFSSPNPNIPWAEAKLQVPLEATPWPEGRLERVSVNSFGIGGTNAHVVLDSAASWNVATPEVEEGDGSEAPHLLVFSANTQQSLEELSKLHSDYLVKNPDRIGDLAYTLSQRRDHLPWKSYVVASKEQPGAVSPPLKQQPQSQQQKPNVVFVFTGQGAQWPTMGRDLLRNNVTFKETIQRLDAHLKTLGADAPEWTIEAELRKPAKTSRLSSAELSQPLCTAIQVGLVDALHKVGVDSDAVVGHSSGEIAGAYASGAITGEEAITAAYYRGLVAAKQTKQGAMAAVGLGWDEVKPYLLGQPGVLTVACDNSPRSVTLSGDRDAVEAAVAKIKADDPDVLARLLQVDKAYHSPHMAEVGGVYLDMVDAKMHALAPNKPFFSSVHGKLLPAGETLGASYWVKNLESPVRFRGAVTSALQQAPPGRQTVFVEIGPHSALAGPLRQIAAEATLASAKNPVPYVNTMVRGASCTEALLSAVGRLWALGISVDFAGLYPASEHVTLGDLPRYPWHHATSHWAEGRATHEWRFPKNRYHDLLGTKTIESSDLEPVWRNNFLLENVPWVRDHQIQGDVVFPFAGFVAIAAEAVRQVIGGPEGEAGFRIRNFRVRAALVVSDDKSTELITTLRPKRVHASSGTSAVESQQWWDVSIMSWNGQSWTKHAVGQVAGLAEALGSVEAGAAAKARAALPRSLPPHKWYEATREAGVDYGPNFQGLENIRTSTTLPGRADAFVAGDRQPDGDNYHLHPTTVDALLQLLTVGASLGLVRRAQEFLATGIRELTVARCSPAVGVHASVSSAFGRSSVLGSAEVVDDQGNVVARMAGAELTLLGEKPPVNTHAAARQVWKPHVDFVPIGEQLAGLSGDAEAHAVALDEMYKLSLLAALPALEAAAGNTVPNHLQRHAQWIKEQAALYASTSTNTSSLSADELQTRLASLAESLAGTPAQAAARAISKMLHALPDILSGTRDASSVLEEEDVSTQLQAFLDRYDRSVYLANLAHTNPSLRVLHLYAGSGAAAQNIIKHLGSSYSRYTFSDTSTSLFESAKLELQAYENVEYATLQIGQPLDEQAFDAKDGYDLIVAVNTLHQTDSVPEALANIKTLLRPNGKVLLQNLNPAAASWVNFVRGAQPGWWKEDAGDDRILNASQWQQHLEAAGFDASKAVGNDKDVTSVVVASIQQKEAQAQAQASNNNNKVKVAILTRELTTDIASIQTRLQEQGYDISRITLDDTPQPGVDILSLIDMQGPFFHDMHEGDYARFRAFTDKITDAGLLWITPLAPLRAKDPRYAQVLGLSRVMRNETGLRFAVALSDDDTVDAEWHQDPKIVEVLRHFQQQGAATTADTNSGEDSSALEMEYALHEGHVKVCRVHPLLLPELLLASRDGDGVALEVTRAGRHVNLQWTSQQQEKLGDDQVEVSVHAASFTSKDAQIATGEIQTTSRLLGDEAAGVVTRVGPNVKTLAVGDRVIALRSAALAATVIASERSVAKIPSGLSYKDAVTLPAAYTLAAYSLITTGQIEQGQAVLIHSAASSVGLAALQIAREAGADIYVTADTQQDAALLVDTWGIASERVLSVADISSSANILRRTDGRGFDIVLNSVSGELAHESWDVVADFGKFVDISSAFGAPSADKFELDLTADNRSYHHVNFDRLRKERPIVISRLLERLSASLPDQSILPIEPLATYTADKAAEAFQLLQQQQPSSSGKATVLELRNADNELLIGSNTVADRKTPSKLDSSASYLLVGGLGGIGRSLATWMTENGARNLVFLGRSAGKPADITFASELESMGASVAMVKGSVTSADDVVRAIAAATQLGPLKGIVNMTMVLHDRAWMNMTWDDWVAAVSPKVQGTWHLHDQSIAAGAHLDFFVLFSSISNLIGNVGQANYASANSFLDAFAQHRRERLGLAATVIQMGAVSGVGHVSESDDLMRQLKASGFYTLGENDVLDAVSVAIAGPSPRTIALGGTSDPVAFATGISTGGSAAGSGGSGARNRWVRDPRFAVYQNTGASSGGESSSGGKGNELKTFLAGATADPEILNTPEAAETLATAIGLKVHGLLSRPADELNLDLGLADMGMDSMIAIEMRMWWRQALGLDISVLEMLGMGTLHTLGAYAAKKLAEQMAA